MVPFAAARKDMALHHAVSPLNPSFWQPQLNLHLRPLVIFHLICCLGFPKEFLFKRMLRSNLYKTVHISYGIVIAALWGPVIFLQSCADAAVPGGLAGAVHK